MFFRTTVCEGSATSSGPTKFPTMTCTRRLEEVWILKSRNAGLDGWDMSYECPQRGYPRLLIGGHLQAKEKGEDPKPPGGGQWKLNLVRWVCHGERNRQLRKTKPGGKETFLRPYAPLGAIRTNIYLNYIKVIKQLPEFEWKTRKVRRVNRTKFS